MNKKESRLDIAREAAEIAVAETNEKIDKLGVSTQNLYELLNDIQALFDQIRNVPEEKRLEYEQLKSIRLNWKQQAEKIETDYKNAAVKNAGTGAAGVGAGVAVAALGPSAAMGIATTFGVASTGTAISTLSGAAATNAALAWLGGGALATGGGGMAVGNAILALVGPVGWAIAGVAILGSGILLLKNKDEKKRMEDVYTLISKRDEKSYQLAIVELEERIVRIEDEAVKLKDAIEHTRTFGTDYSVMTEARQYELGSYVNLMNASTQLLVNPIMGLQPLFTEADLEAFIHPVKGVTRVNLSENVKGLVIAIANLIYKIDLSEKDQELLWKTLRKNKQFLESMGVEKKEFESYSIKIAMNAIKAKEK